MLDNSFIRHSDWPKAVVFDLDGTLIDSVADIADSLNHALGERGYPPFDTAKVRLMIGGGIPKLIERAFLAHGLEPSDMMPVINDFLRIYATSGMAKTTLYDGAKPLLEHLHASGIKIGLCTNKQQDMTDLILKSLGIGGYFGSVIGERPDLPRKPDAAPLRLCLSELGVMPHEAIMVGDSAADTGVARAAGVRVVLVSYGYTHTPVESLGADAIIHHLGELEAALLALKPL